jgi:hypothetical protein
MKMQTDLLLFNKTIARFNVVLVVVLIFVNWWSDKAIGSRGIHYLVGSVVL